MGAAVVGPPQAAPRSRKAVVALVLAVLSVLLGWLLAFVLLTPLAIVFGVLALRDVRQGEAIGGHRMAWTAIVIAVLSPLLWVLLIFLALAAGSGGGAYFG